jgi:hypothetical protein
VDKRWIHAALALRPPHGFGLFLTDGHGFAAGTDQSNLAMR